MKSLLFRTCFILVLFTLSYLLLFLLPQRRRLASASHDLNLLTKIHSQLLQNHLALIQIPRLNPKAPNFAADQANLLALISSSRDQTQKALDQTPKNPAIASLIEETKKLLESQPNLIENYHPDSPDVAAFTKRQSELLAKYQAQLTTLKTHLLPFVSKN